MALSGSRLNGVRYASIYAGLQAQFPIPGDLQPSEIAQCTTFQQKFAHAIADTEGDDVVDEITGNAVVPLGIAVTIPSTANVGLPSSGATSATGTVT